MTKMVIKGGGVQLTRPFVLEFTSGDWIFEEGDLGTEMYIVQSGKVEVVQRIRGEEKRLAVLEKGDFFGEMAILEGLPRGASVRALEAVRVVEVNGSTFGQMLVDNPEIAVRMMRKLSRRLRNADELLRGMSDPGSTVADPPEGATQAERRVAHQYLLNEASGEKFFLSADRETTVGRTDPVTNITPDIDLTAVDPERSTSRRHAVIHRRGNKFYLTEEIGTTNGTFIGTTRLQTSAPLEIEDGYRLRFGLVELSFCAAN